MRNNIEILNFIKDSTFLEELADHFFLDLASSIKLIGELFSISNTPNFVNTINYFKLYIFNKEKYSFNSFKNRIFS